MSAENGQDWCPVSLNLVCTGAAALLAVSLNGDKIVGPS
jgi:hypothetical protein